MGRRLTVALVIGSAACVAQDIDAARAIIGEPDGVVCCNEAGVLWPTRFDAWVSLHPHFFDSAANRRWAARRDEKGLPRPKLYVAHEQPPAHFCRPLDLLTANRFPGQRNSGSSGMFAAKVALVDLGFDTAVLCGIPLDPQPHFHDDKPWADAMNYHAAWREIPSEFRKRMRSMSGWTRELLGAPEARAA